MLRGEIRNKRIVLQLTTADDLLPVTGGRVELQEVVLNLLLNALRAGVRSSQTQDTRLEVDRRNTTSADRAPTDVMENGHVPNWLSD